MDKIAKTIILAAKIREDSYDNIAADKASKTADNQVCVNYFQFYTKTMIEAEAEAAKATGIDELGSHIVKVLLRNCWNDALSWADMVEKKMASKEMQIGGS